MIGRGSGAAPPTCGWSVCVCVCVVSRLHAAEACRLDHAAIRGVSMWRDIAFFVYSCHSACHFHADLHDRWQAVAPSPHQPIHPFSYPPTRPHLLGRMGQNGLQACIVLARLQQHCQHCEAAVPEVAMHKVDLHWGMHAPHAVLAGAVEMELLEGVGLTPHVQLEV